MKLMTYLGLALVFSVPAKAVYVDGGIECYTSSVNADAQTVLEYWDYWDGWEAAFSGAQITGPGSDTGTDYAWYPEYWASAYASVPNAAAGTYDFLGWHYIYHGLWNSWYWVYSYTSSCEVFGSSGSSDPTPVIESVTPSPWTAGQTYTTVNIHGSGFGTSPQLTITGSVTFVQSTAPAPTDTDIYAVVTVNPDAPNGTATVQVTAGYTGRNFYQPPGGGGAQSNTQGVPVQGAPSCPTPAGETSIRLQSYRETRDGTGFSGALFRGVLQLSNLTDNFFDRQVIEDVSQGEPNACWFQFSGLPTVLPPGANASWQVTGFQEYGPDYIALADPIIDAVQSFIRAGVAPYTSCRAFDNPQVMKIAACGGGSSNPTTYDNHRIWLDISATGVTVGRDNASGSGR